MHYRAAKQPESGIGHLERLFCRFGGDFIMAETSLCRFSQMAECANPSHGSFPEVAAHG
jgi:hypothetical protein